MMKMHGLGDGPYWIISYGYFLAISVIYMFCFVTFGSVIGKTTAVELFPLLSIFPVFLNVADVIFRVEVLHIE